MTGDVSGLPTAAIFGIFAAVLVVVVIVVVALARRSSNRQLSQRLNALGTRLGLDPPSDENNLETSISYLEQVTGAATEAVASSSADAIRLRRSLDTLSQGIVLCDENGTVVYRNARATALMTSRHGDALAAQAVTDLLEDAWHEGSAEHTLDLYGPPRRTLTVRAMLIDDGRRPLGVMAMIEDVSERRRLEEIRRDFVANVSHELKTPMGALGLLAETLVSELDVQVAKRLAERIHTEAFRVSRIIDDLLDLSRIESEEAPPREPVPVDLVMADATERVRAAAEQRGIEVQLLEPEPPVTVFGDRRQLVSAMHALLENAVTYSYDNSKIVVSATVVRPEPGSGEGAEAAPAVPVAAGVTGDTLDAARETSVAGAGDAAGGETATTSDDRGPLEPGAAGAPPGPFDTGQIAVPSAAVSPPLEGAVASGSADASTRAERPMVHLSVTDQGIGIPARDLNRIFERFYRVDHGRSRDTGGTGLGLSIVRHVANNHNGWVDVESREGEGSTFTLALPLAEGPGAVTRGAL